MKKALIGFHERIFREAIGDIFVDKGYEGRFANTPEEMLEQVRQNNYDWYCMDANLGNAGIPNITSSQQVYDLIKEQVEKGLVKFLALSASSSTVDEARKAGIPIMDKIEFVDKYRELIE